MIARRILIAGGGVAALEAMMALRALVGSLVHVELVAPEVEFSYRPVAVAAPFGMGEVRRFELAKIAADHDAHHRQDSVAEVDRRASVAVTESGERLVMTTSCWRPEPIGTRRSKER